MFGKLPHVPDMNLVQAGGEIRVKDDPPQYEVLFNDAEPLRNAEVWFDARVLWDILM